MRSATVVASITSRSITCPTLDGTVSGKKRPTLDGTVYEASIAKKVSKSPRWFAKAPASVSLDTSLNAEAFRVYCVMALKTKGTICSVGVRHLEKILGIPKSNLARRIGELVAAGHLEALPRADGKRGRYRFTSPAFLKACKGCKMFTENLDDNGKCWLCAEKAKSA